MTQPWDETVGADAIPGPYAACWHRGCPSCGAQPGSKCTFVLRRGMDSDVRFRHAPCLARNNTPVEEL